MKRFLLYFIMFFVALRLNAQCDHPHHQDKSSTYFHKCILDEVIIKKVKNDPGIIDRYVKYENEQRQLMMLLEENPHTIKNFKGTDTLINGRRIVPVVFHVIHKYGFENISREQVEDAITLLNLDYNKQNADTANTFPLFKDRAADAMIEFRLAKIDPWGNCTDGIVRVYDPRTDYAYFNVMRDNSWPYSKYMNVYAVNFIYPEGMILPAGALIGGLSPLTPDNMLSPSAGDTLLDGVLVRHDCVGSIGTATSMAGSGINNYNRVMTHETGHFFNLYHPFQNLMASVLGLDNCTHMSWLGLNGDEVDDTPPVKQATQGCPTPGSVNSCTTTISGYGDEPDMIENYMDYANGVCQNIFTDGQLSRINATMMGTRRDLWSYENLISTGVLDTLPSQCEPIAEFSANRNLVCEGASVTFSDFSFNGQATEWEWTFPGGTPATSTDQNPVVTYSTAGSYDVTLKAINSFGDNTITKASFIHVGTGAGSTTAPFTQGFEQANVLNNFLTENSVPGLVKWERTTNAAYSGSASLKLNSNNTDILAIDAIITPAYDLTNIQYPRLKFKFAYKGVKMSDPLGGGDLNNYGDLKIYVSTNCGQTWQPRKTINDSALATVPIGDTASFKPTSQAQWKEDIVAALNNVSGNPNVMFKFEFKNKGGNNLYIDDINVYNDNVGIEEQQTNFDVNIYPNPVTDETKISFFLENNASVKVQLYDILGKEVMNIYDGQLESGEHIINFERKGIHSGMYFIHLFINNNTIVKPVSVN